MGRALERAAARGKRREIYHRPLLPRRLRGGPVGLPTWLPRATTGLFSRARLPVNFPRPVGRLMASLLRKIIEGKSMPRTVPAVAFSLTLGSLAALAGCTSRTLPLPPPEVTQVSPPDPSGFVTVQGRAREGASVGVVNDMTATGAIVASTEQDCGSACPFEARVQADSGDQIRVWQFYETEGSIEVQVP